MRSKINIKQFYSFKINNNKNLINSLSLIANDKASLDEIKDLKYQNRILKKEFNKEKKDIYKKSRADVKKINETYKELKTTFVKNKRSYDEKTFNLMKNELENIKIRKHAVSTKKYIDVYGTSRGKTLKEKTTKFNRIAAIIVILALFLVPFWMVISFSTKTNVESADATAFAAFTPNGTGTSINYDLAMVNLQFWNSIVTTLVLTIVSNVVILIFASMAAWQLVRNDRWWSKIVFYIFVAAMILPFQSIMIPLISQMQKMELRGSILGTIIAYVGFGMALSIFMMHGFLKTVPRALEESAAISGMGPFRIYVKIVIPLLKNTFITILVLNIMWIWNDYLLPSLMLNDPYGNQTLQVRLIEGLVSATSTDLKALSAGAVILIVPPIIYFAMSQKKMVSGITNGSIK